jgi:hypothetical protein
MNARERRAKRRKLQSDGAKKAYARLGGKIIEVEILDTAPPPRKRDPRIFDGETLKEIPRVDAEAVNVSDEIFTSLVQEFSKIFDTQKLEKKND